MGQTFNIYCDESCHLEHDDQEVMVLGAVWCLEDKAREAFVRLREIREAHGLARAFEIKWTKVSPAKVEFYRDVLDYFFDDDDLCFRAIVIPNKSKLRHDAFGQTHDEWYYKMYFDMLKVIFSPQARYRVYLDYKDTQGAAKVEHLHRIICDNMYDFSHQIVERMQLVRSHEVELLQLADLLIGAIAYANRGLTGSTAKTTLVSRMRVRSDYSLTRTTLYRENKVNLLRWQAREESSG